MKKFIISLVILLGFTSAANAQVKDKKFKNWTVYTVDMQGKKTCYIASFPRSKSGNYKKRDDPYFMVTYIGNDVAEVSTSSGYKYASGSKVDVNIDNTKFNMFTAGELAWADNRQADKSFITAMKKGNYLTAKGTSTLGTYSIDKYSLSGFTDAYERMTRICQ